MDDILKAFQEAEADEGFSGGECLPRGQYPVVVHVQRTGTSQERGTPYVDLDLEVVDGPYKGRHAFVRYWLLDVYGADPSELRDKESKAFRNLQRCKGLMHALGFEQPAQAEGTYESTGDASLVFWRVPEWDGRRMIAGLQVETAEKQMQQAQERGFDLENARDRNRLTSWKPLNDETLQAWREKELPRQMRAAGKQTDEQKPDAAQSI